MTAARRHCVAQVGTGEYCGLKTIVYAYILRTRRRPG